jgi:hypothetical protein
MGNIILKKADKLGLLKAEIQKAQTLLIVYPYGTDGLVAAGAFACALKVAYPTLRVSLVGTKYNSVASMEDVCWADFDVVVRCGTLLCGHELNTINCFDLMQTEADSSDCKAIFEVVATEFNSSQCGFTQAHVQWLQTWRPWCSIVHGFLRETNTERIHLFPGKFVSGDEYLVCSPSAAYAQAKSVFGMGKEKVVDLDAFVYTPFVLPGSAHVVQTLLDTAAPQCNEEPMQAMQQELRKLRERLEDIKMEDSKRIAEQPATKGMPTAQIQDKQCTGDQGSSCTKAQEAFYNPKHCNEGRMQAMLGPTAPAANRCDIDFGAF